MVGFLLIGLPAGAWLDRRRRRPVLVASDLIRAGLLASVPIAALIGWLSVPQLIIVSLFLGLARVLFDVGYRSYLPSVIGKERVLAGNATVEFIRSSGQVAGPGLGGVLVAVIGAAAVIGLQAVALVASAVSLLAIRSRETVAPAGVDRPSLRAQIAEGLSYVWSDRILRTIALASAVSNVSFAMASAVSMIFLSRTLALPTAAIGVIIAAGSGAAMVGAAITTRLARAVGSVRLIWLSLAVTTPLTILGALAQPGWSVVLIVIGIAAGELGQIVYAITSVSLRQRICPDRLLGRVNATMTVLIMGLFPLGAVVGGVLGELIGARGTLLATGAVALIAPILLITSRLVRTEDGYSKPQF
jgi:MFS family permease